MESSFWINKWENNSIGFHQQKVNRKLQAFFPHLNLTDNDKVFVPLCGKSLDMLWLWEKNLHVIGNEISSVAVSAFAEENSMAFTEEDVPFGKKYCARNFEIHCQDFFSMQQNPELKAIYDRAALIAMPPQMREDYANKMANLAPKGCRMLLLAIVYHCPEEMGPPFSVAPSEVEVLFKEKFTIEILNQQEETLKNPKFASKGISNCTETAYLLTRL